jgi:type I restriction enzyme, R subunit
MNEAETRAELIDPALHAAGWGVVEGSRVRREVIITHGRIEGSGRRGRKDVADYVLTHRTHKLAVIEAKPRDAGDTEGLGQAKNYAGKLQCRFAYSTNGVGIYEVDMLTGAEGYVDRYPTPDELWQRVYAEENAWRDRFAAVPYEEKGGSWSVRYYQDNAIDNVLEAIAGGQDRILLTMATGTGKTAVAFQITWKLFHSRWNLSGEPTRRPRILFLADRNILADQAFNAFSPFPEDALVRIDPQAIRKKGRVPKNGSLFFTIFQTFMTQKAAGPSADVARHPRAVPVPREGGDGDPVGASDARSLDSRLRGNDGDAKPESHFGDYPPDFFDFIVIDECHRGGANDESNWRGILEYFAPAVQLGLTATPKRNNNVDTYKYFGEPVYIYSLKEGINDGYLTPFRVKQVSTTLDEYTYTSDDEVIEGEIEVGEHFEESDFNRIIEIKEREEHRVKLLLEMIDQREKTLVFCATQDHAAAVRDLINQHKTSSDPLYCVRVTANDGALGEQYLRTFQDNEKTIPTILTTSQKLSTGVDARNVRNIVLLRPINSIIEFKQIVGRGTRLYEGKTYFTIYDFVRAYEHFNDPEWDGEPLEPEPTVCATCGESPCTCEPKEPRVCPTCGKRPCECPKEACAECGFVECICEKRRRIQVKLADGKERQIQNMVATSFWSPDGKPMSAAEFIERLFGDLPELFQNEDELRELWSKPDTRKGLMEGLSERGYGQEQLAEIATLINAEKSDIYDVLAYIGYATAPITREVRVLQRRPVILGQHDASQQEFLDFVLNHYVAEGVGELDDAKLPHLLELKYHGTQEAVAALGPAASIRKLFVDFQRHLYSGPGAA